MKKISILLGSLALSTFVHAAPIEQRNLSNAQTAVAESNQQNSLLWDMRQTISQLQNQIRDLRGQIEEQNNQIEQMQNDLKNRYTDLDQRLELLNQKVDAESGELAEPDAEAQPEENSAPTNNPSSEPQSAPTITNSNADQQTQATQAPLSDKDAYALAYDAYKQGGAASAIQPMEKFIQQHPTSAYVSNAYYWLGEFDLSLTPPNYNQAKDNFEIVAGNYPQSNKAAASLYRLSEIAKNVDQDIPRAREYYLKLIQNYSNSKEAETAKTAINL